MQFVFRPLVLSIVVLTAMAAVAQDSPAAQKVENFRLLDHRGDSHELYRNSDADAVVLYVQGNGCPIVRQSFPRLEEIKDTYQKKNVRFFMLNANVYDTRDEIKTEISDYKVGMPVLMDTTQLVARSLGCDRTAEAIVINPKDWTIFYRGPVDDRFDYGARKPEATEDYLVEALDALLAGKTIETSSRVPKGCKINLFPFPEVNYTEHIAPILEKNCATCHRKGDVGPFAMNGYNKVKGWSSMIREVIMTDRMPPWSSDNEVQKFANDRSLTDEQKIALAAWAQEGTPRGEGDDPLENLPERESAWSMGEPDAVISIPEPYDLPAEGVLEYHVVTVPTNFTEDKWVHAIEVVPTEREAVHHALIFIQYPEALKKYEPDADGGADGYFGGFVPGAGPEVLPEGTGKFIPAGSSFQFQIHYVTTGKPLTDHTQMGLYFLDEPPAERMETVAASNGKFEIPPHKRNYRVKADTYIGSDFKLWGFAPHMHYRGASMKYTANLPDKSRVELCSVPNYQFDWQTGYLLPEPMTFPRGTRIVVDGTFDNSAANPYNPDPDQTVRFGDQTFDEMFIGYMWVSAPPEVYTEMADNRTGHVEGQKQRFREENAELFEMEPMTEQDLIGTTWSGGDFKLGFRAEGKFVVNDLIPGKWRMENNKVYIEVVGDKFELDVVGNALVSDMRYKLDRLE
ncbi:MAG: redoxin domain-containing protein [Candidatus Hydrogenedens sp.]|nr:redoxin domain-containing protein [Candidatus Hydrogenedens sp.]